MKISFRLASQVPRYPLITRQKKKLNHTVIDFGVNKADVNVTETREKRNSLLIDHIQLSPGLQSKHRLSELEKAVSLQLVSLIQC